MQRFDHRLLHFGRSFFQGVRKLFIREALQQRLAGVLVQVVQNGSDVRGWHLHQPGLRDGKAQRVIVLDGGHKFPGDHMGLGILVERSRQATANFLQAQSAQQAIPAGVHTGQEEVLALACDLQVVHAYQALAFGVHDLLVQDPFAERQFVTAGVVGTQFSFIHPKGDAGPKGGNLLRGDVFILLRNTFEHQRAERGNGLLGTVNQYIVQAADHMTKRVPNFLIQ